ncbi:MAG: RNA methyltransferase [Terriglobales bacterium]
MTDHLDNLRVVLVAVRNPLNIGAAARAMSNFGVQKLRVVKPYEPAFREARSAVGAAGLLAQAEQYDTVAEAVADCRLVVGTTAAGHRELLHRLQPLEIGGRTIKRRLKTGPVALLFGSERYGLSNQELSFCHWAMRIPTREAHGSMNLGQAVAVCLYELVRGRNKAPTKKSLAKTSPGKAPSVKKEKTSAASGDVERMTQLLFSVLDASGYVHPRIAAGTEEKLRRLVRRMNLNVNDTVMWLGMLRQMAWKLGAKQEGNDIP